MDQEYYAKLCDARDTLCEYCDSAFCETCTVRQLIMNAANDLPDECSGESFTAYAYEDDGLYVDDLSVYDNKEDAITFAKSRNWDEVVDDLSGEVVWKRTKG